MHNRIMFNFYPGPPHVYYCDVYTVVIFSVVFFPSQFTSESPWSWPGRQAILPAHLSHRKVRERALVYHRNYIEVCRGLEPWESVKLLLRIGCNFYIDCGGCCTRAKEVECWVGKHQHQLAHQCSPSEKVVHTWSVKLNIMGIWEWDIYGL